MSESEQEFHPETLTEKSPSLIINVYYNLVLILSAYGWFLLGGVVIGLYVWHNFLAGWFSVWQARKEQAEYDAKYHKDPDMERARQEQIERARKRMQEESDQKAAAFAERQKEREEARKQEKAAERARLTGQSDGRRLRDGMDPESNNQTENNQRPNFRPEYNPLMGAGSGTYRAPRRSGCPGGGCNK